MRKLTAILVASALTLGTAGMAQANDAPRGHGPDAKMMKEGPRGPMHHEGMFKDLNLTEAQKKQIGDITRAARDKMHQLGEEERRALHEVVTAATFDAAKAQAQLDKQAENRKARELNRLETQNKIYNILTAEQKKQFNDNIEKRQEQRPPMPEERGPAQ